MSDMFPTFTATATENPAISTDKGVMIAAVHVDVQSIMQVLHALRTARKKERFPVLCLCNASASKTWANAMKFVIAICMKAPSKWGNIGLVIQNFEILT
eukprot:554219-Pelagomonas_calceolata.AAC.1